MCGILFVLSCDHGRTQVVEESLLPLLHHRGPDGVHSYSTTKERVTSTGAEDDVVELRFHGTVLHLRGELTKQPLTDSDGHVLLWNGEIFGGNVEVPENVNDTSVLFEKLRKLHGLDDSDTHEQITSIFGAIQGPWAFVYYDATNGNIWYGRDYFGRRSLLSSFEGNTFCLSSLGHRRFANEFVEVPVKLLYCLDIHKLNDNEFTNAIKTYPIQPFNADVEVMTRNRFVQHRCLNHNRLKNHDNVENQGLVLQEHENVVVVGGNEVGDQDESFESVICHCAKSEVFLARDSLVNTDPDNKLGQNKLDSDSESTLINSTRCTTDIKENSVERKCCHCLNLYHDDAPGLNDDITPNASHNKEVCYSMGCVNSVVGNESESCENCNRLRNLPDNMLSINRVRERFARVLEEAVRKRVFNIPRAHGKRDIDEKVSKIGILFSGGIDSVVLTYLADRCTPPWESIDLINVAFAQKPKTQQNIKKKHQKPVDNPILNFDVPDRITGRTALKELPRQRQWNFIEVDVHLEELQEKRGSRITNLVYPLDSVLDDSIGCAIWFAARGVGRCYTLSHDGELQLQHEHYESPVKVLLTGMGADEQLGGYARHRTKFESSGWVGLQTEMKMELERISSRNLGRDDRCISDHGREARFPFLDEQVVSFLQEIPVCVKCDPRLPRGVGEKILLREVASTMGLRYASTLPKRAIQFGSKIAKMESSREKGSDSCKRL